MDVDDEIGERLSAAQPGERVVLLRELPAIAIGKIEPAVVFVDAGPELGGVGQAIHLKRRGIRPHDPAVRFDQYDPVAHPSDDLLQLAAVGLVRSRRVNFRHKS